VRFSVERRVTMCMAVLGVLVLGWLSLERLPLEFLPSFASSSISVNAPYPSASPQEVERAVLRPLEDGLGAINGLDQLVATASEGSANLNLTFIDGTDMELAAVDVRDRIDRVRSRLPDDLERIFVRRFQSTDIPVLRSSLSAPWPRDQVYDFAERILQPRLERLEGVAQVSVRGLQSKTLQVNVHPARLAAAGIDSRELANALLANNVNISGGSLREGSRRYLVRSVGELRHVEEIRRLPIRADGLRLGDVAEVTLDFPERTFYSYLNGEQSLYVAINKQSTANLLEVVDRVKEEYRRLEDEAAGLTVRHFNDASVDVRQGLSELGRAGILGGGLAILFTYLFLRKFRTTLLVAIAIPISLVLTFVILYLARELGITNMTLNVMSLMGLMLAVGMLLDNSIVVVESIFRHRLELGRDSRTASLRGASEVALPIIAATATTMCVFLPLIFAASSSGGGGGRGGGFSRFMVDIGTTVCIVMVASLVVSLTVVPMVAPFLLRSEARTKPRWLDALVHAYGALIRVTLRHRLAFTVGAVALLGFSWWIYGGIERTFSPPSQARQVTLLVDTPRRYSEQERLHLFDEIYRVLDAHRSEWEIADITHELRTAGGRSRGRGGFGGNRFELFLTPEEDSRLRTGEIQELVRAALPVKAGIDYKLAQTQHGPPGAGSSEVRLELAGQDLEILELLSPHLIARLRELPFLRDVDSSLESGEDEIRVTVDRARATQSGLTSRVVAQTISTALTSRNLSYFRAEDREIGMVLQYRQEDRETLDQLERMPVFAGATQLPVGALASFEVEPGARTIEREDRRPKIEITAGTGDMPSFAAMGAIRGALADMPLPEGYEWKFGRSWMDAQSDARQATVALLVAVLLVYMIMAALFEDFVQPLTILLSIPFGFIGVGLVMKLAGQPRSSAADMGLVILAGIVVNNAIVLIDHVNGLRRGGMSRDEAMVLGGQHRLRPILLTAITTILGLLPMVLPFFLPSVFGQPEGRAAFWAPVGLVILGGLTTSTFLTLLIIPTVYTLLDDAVGFVRRAIWSARHPSHEIHNPEIESPAS
jgi:hydrophobic/amphiphilic exporter-1 (mainly G- bacteria), HAE1 family